MSIPPDSRLWSTVFARFRADAWRALALAVLASLIWMAHHDKWTWESWQLPTDYFDDAPEILARIKAAAEGDTWPLRPQVIERLGAPWGAHWNAYPTPDKPLMLGLGALAAIFGVYSAANFGLMLAQVSAALSFYLAARWLRCRWEWSWMGALLFAYTYHTFHRGLSHFSFVFTWTVPLGLLAVWLVAGSKRLDWGRPGAVVCIFAAIALGVSNPYNLFFWLQLMGWALVAQLFGARRRPNLEIGAMAMVVSIAAFAVMHAENWLYVDDRGALPLLARNYGGTERYALKAVEMFIPPSFHRWDWLAFFGNRYARWSEWRGEIFLPYLGLVGVIGFAWLVGATLRRAFSRKALPGQALSVGWILAYGSIGGVTNLLALFAGMQLFRATNRAAIFVSALVLIFLVRRLSRVTSSWTGWQRFAMAAGVVVVGIFDQMPRPSSPGRRAEVAAMVDGDQRFGRELERALPPRAMVFQLPVVGFPEIVPPHRLGDYEHFRPFLNTTSLRFSYGAPKFRARSRWQRDLEGLPIGRIVRRLESYGFAALYLNRKGFDDRAEAVLRELTTLGYTRRIEGPQGNQVVVLLQPASSPRLPLARTLTFGQGWHPRIDDGVRWAFADASMSYFNPEAQPIELDLELTLSGASPRVLELAQNGHVISTLAVDSAPKEVCLRRVRLAPGINRFDVRSSEGPVRSTQGRYQLRAFALHAAGLNLLSEPAMDL